VHLIESPKLFWRQVQLRVVYGRLNIAVEFEDVLGKRALELSSAGEFDEEVQGIADLASHYPMLVQISPPINYIGRRCSRRGLVSLSRKWRLPENCLPPPNRHRTQPEPAPGRRSAPSSAGTPGSCARQHEIPDSSHFSIAVGFRLG
jgi:hypothetical protein